MNKTLVIFDLDGTLLNTITDLGVACNFALAKNGYPTHDSGKYPYMVGGGIARLVERALPEGSKTKENIESVLADFVSYYTAHIHDFTTAYDGIIDLLHKLNSASIVVAVASNKFDAGTQKLISYFFADITFGAVYGNREGMPLKPSADLIYKIMDQCGVSDKSRVYMVGDSNVDMLTAQNGAIHSIGVSWGFRSVEELKSNKAEYIVSNPKEILDIVK